MVGQTKTVHRVKEQGLCHVWLQWLVQDCAHPNGRAVTPPPAFQAPNACALVGHLTLRNALRVLECGVKLAKRRFS